MIKKYNTFYISLPKSFCCNFLQTIFLISLNQVSKNKTIKSVNNLQIDIILFFIGYNKYLCTNITCDIVNIIYILLVIQQLNNFNFLIFTKIII